MSTLLQSQSESQLADRYEALFRVSQAISAHRDPKRLFAVLAGELRHVVDFTFLSVLLYDEKTHTMRPHVFEISDGVLEDFLAREFLPEETLSWWVHQNQQPLAVPCVEQETRFPRMMAFLKDQDIQSVCTFPLTTSHRRLGGLSIGSARPNAYSEDEICFLSLVANHIAVAIDDALNLDASRLVRAELEQKQYELQRERDRLKLLLDVNNSIVSNLELRDLLRAVSASVRRVMQCDAVGVDLPDAETNQLRIYALDFPDGKGLLREELRVPIEGTPPGKAFQTGQPVLCSQADLSEQGFENCLASVVDEGLKSGCFLPLVGRNGMLGVLGLGTRQENAFGQDDVAFLTQVANQISLALENAFAYGQIADLKDQLAQEKLYLEDEIRTELNFEEIIGSSRALRRVLQQVETVAPTDSAVLILGETGTGKELIARAIHNHSHRKDRTFVRLNCAAIPTGLLESELFGHEKGAFTGAIAQRIGRFELANNGTAFLDEIGEVPLELQPKLLRVLQEREFERLGSTRTLRTDARLVAATNRDLTAMVDEQKFRADLFYRLNVFPVRVPSLRERPEDIPLLVRHFAQQFARRSNKAVETIPSETMNALVGYHWPGNVRELQNVIERAVILSTGPALKVPLNELRPRVVADGARTQDTLQEAERKHILAILDETKWVLSGPHGAAVRLGLNRSTLQFRMKKMGIARPA